MGLTDNTNSAAQDASSGSKDWISQAESYIGDKNMDKIRSKIGEERFDKYEKQAHEKLASFGSKKSDSKTSTGGMPGKTAQESSASDSVPSKRSGMNTGMGSESVNTQSNSASGMMDSMTGSSKTGGSGQY
ncbi:hypothetical protein WICPIJ_006144 [Wickerhamomyces pijperi]|uniref:Uncharacterized protein n=1 Tax=Wickerhamomyces pijperi TaxID=599730 RepID=A0A9P8Q285_WICPI|nr:hypothetical protein WICPIJ_006144 [Wickerhamomyces pijperi]